MEQFNELDFFSTLFYYFQCFFLSWNVLYGVGLVLFVLLLIHTQLLSEPLDSWFHAVPKFSSLRLQYNPAHSVHTLLQL